jgi:hypothetical protein
MNSRNSARRSPPPFSARATILLHHGDDDGRPPLTGDTLRERLADVLTWKISGSRSLHRLARPPVRAVNEGREVRRADALQAGRSPQTKI